MSDNDPAKTAVFISYAREDSDSAERLYNELKKTGFKPWLDKYNINAGQDWMEEIMDAIENSSRYFIPLFSSFLF
jgi:predicted esterase